MYKKLIVLLVVVGCLGLGIYIFREEKDYYSLEELKIYLKQADSIRICLYDSQSTYQACPSEKIVQFISDKEQISKIISYVVKSDESERRISTMEGPGFVIQVYDEHKNFLVNLFYDPSLVLARVESSYTLESDYQEQIMSLIKIEQKY